MHRIQNFNLFVFIHIILDQNLNCKLGHHTILKIQNIKKYEKIRWKEKQ